MSVNGSFDPGSLGCSCSGVCTNSCSCSSVCGTCSIFNPICCACQGACAIANEACSACQSVCRGVCGGAASCPAIGPNISAGIEIKNFDFDSAFSADVTLNGSISKEQKIPLPIPSEISLSFEASYPEEDPVVSLSMDLGLVATLALNITNFEFQASLDNLGVNNGLLEISASTSSGFPTPTATADWETPSAAFKIIQLGQIGVKLSLGVEVSGSLSLEDLCPDLFSGSFTPLEVYIQENFQVPQVTGCEAYSLTSQSGIDANGSLTAAWMFSISTPPWEYDFYGPAQLAPTLSGIFKDNGSINLSCPAPHFACPQIPASVPRW